MRKLTAALLLYLGLASAALAQNFSMPPPAGVQVGGFVVVSSCGGQTLTAGKPAFATMDTTGKLCDVGGSGGGLSVQDGATFTAGTSNFTPTGGVFNDSVAPLNSGDQGTVRLNTNREVHVTVDAASSNALWNILNQNLSALNTASLLQGLSSEQTAVSSGNPQKMMGDLVGKLVTSPYANRENMARGAATLSGTSAGTILAASGSSSLKEYVTDLTCTRNDAGTTAVSITLNDTATTIIDVPNNGGGGGYAHTFNVPLAFAANTAATATSGTSITSIHCSATGFYGY